MPVTTDEFPGTRIETRVKLEDQGVDPVEIGVLLLNGSVLAFRDGIGILNPAYVRVSSNDQTTKALIDKLVGDGLAFEEVNDGADESILVKQTFNRIYKRDVNPNDLITTGNASKKIANDYAVLELAAASSSYGAWSFFLRRTPTADIKVRVQFFLKAAGTGSVVRIAAKAKARGAGDDAATPFDIEVFNAVTVTITTIGEIFETVLNLNKLLLNASEGDSIAIHVGRDAGNDLAGPGALDDYSKRVQICGLELEVP